MRKLLLPLILFSTLNGWAQHGDTLNNKTENQNLISKDSNSINPQLVNDSLFNTISAPDSNEISKNLDRNINALLELQNNRRAKEKRNAMIRIGIGVAFLIVLVIGLRRKTIKK